VLPQFGLFTKKVSISSTPSDRKCRVVCIVGLYIRLVRRSWFIHNFYFEIFFNVIYKFNAWEIIQECVCSFVGLGSRELKCFEQTWPVIKEHRNHKLWRLTNAIYIS